MAAFPNSMSPLEQSQGLAILSYVLFGQTRMCLLPYLFSQTLSAKVFTEKEGVDGSGVGKLETVQKAASTCTEKKVCATLITGRLILTWFYSETVVTAFLEILIKYSEGFLVVCNDLMHVWAFHINTLNIDLHTCLTLCLYLRKNILHIQWEDRKRHYQSWVCHEGKSYFYQYRPRPDTIRGSWGSNQHKHRPSISER